MFTADIPPGQDTSNKQLILKSNAGSREAIFNFIKENALSIFGSERVTFSKEQLYTLTAIIK